MMTSQPSQSPSKCSLFNREDNVDHQKASADVSDRGQASMLRRLCRSSSRVLSTATTDAPTAAASSGGGIKFWHVALGVSAPIAYYIVRDRRKTSALQDASTHLISPLRSEVEDLSKRSNLSHKQVERLQSELRTQRNWSSEQLSYLIGRETSSIQPWEILCLFRNSPTDKQNRLDSLEIAVGVSSLAKGAELELTWRVIDPDLGPLNFELFSNWLDCMLRTGHFSGSCLLKQTRILPPEWSILSGQGLAERYYSSLNKQRDDVISFEEFKTKANGLSADGDIVLWYLQRKPSTEKS